jgi:hypothetical protein
MNNLPSVSEISSAQKIITFFRPKLSSFSSAKLPETTIHALNLGGRSFSKEAFHVSVLVKCLWPC